jgi:hypothetical protein
MKVQRFQDLIAWTGALHQHLAACLERCGAAHADQRTRWLLSYLAAREAAIVTLVFGFLEHADPKALHTWIYDYTPHPVIDPQASSDLPYSRMAFDEIVAKVLQLHNHALDLYRQLAARAEIPEARDLLEELCAMEEHETKLMARQAGRIRDL